MRARKMFRQLQRKFVKFLYFVTCNNLPYVDDVCRIHWIILIDNLANLGAGQAKKKVTQKTIRNKVV
jgi:hypothetical protein